MPVYSVKVKGSRTARVVRASTASQARNHVVTAEPLTADGLADLLTKGATIEQAGGEEQAESSE